MTILFSVTEKEKVGLVRNDLIKVICEQPREDFRQRDRVRLGRRLGRRRAIGNCPAAAV